MPQTKEEHIQDQNGSSDSDSDSSSDSSSDHGSASSSRHSVKSERHRRHSITAPMPPILPPVDHTKVCTIFNRLLFHRVATNLENLEYSGISLNMENSLNSVQPRGKIVPNKVF